MISIVIISICTELLDLLLTLECCLLTSDNVICTVSNVGLRAGTVLGIGMHRCRVLSQPIDCATKQTKKWLTDGAHRGGTEDKRIDLPRLEGREGQGLLSCLQWKGRERTED